MTNQRLLAHGLIAGLTAGLAGVIYAEIYQYLMLTDFTRVMNWVSILGACVFGCIVMSLGYWLVYRLKRARLLPWVNVLIAVTTFGSIYGPFMAQLPFDLEAPELFIGLAVPMHFFPALSFFGPWPFFSKNIN